MDRDRIDGIGSVGMPNAIGPEERSWSSRLPIGDGVVGVAAMLPFRMFLGYASRWPTDVASDRSGDSTWDAGAA